MAMSLCVSSSFELGAWCFFLTYQPENRILSFISLYLCVNFRKFFFQLKKRVEKYHLRCGCEFATSEFALAPVIIKRAVGITQGKLWYGQVDPSFLPLEIKRRESIDPSPFFFTTPCMSLIPNRSFWHHPTLIACIVAVGLYIKSVWDIKDFE